MLKNILQKIDKKALITSLLIGAAASLLGYLALFQRNFFSKTYLGLTFVLFIATSLTVYFLHPRIQKIAGTHTAGKHRKILLPISFILACLLIGNFEVRPFYTILPKTNLNISINPISGSPVDSIELVHAANPMGSIPLSRFEMTGEWWEENGRVIISSAEPFEARWQGAAGEYLDLFFKPASIPLIAIITINGSASEIELHQPDTTGDIHFRQEIPIPFTGYLPFIFSFLITSTALIYLLLLLLAGLPSYEPFKNVKPMWPLASLPLICVCLLSLFVFWPGIMSSDSMGQWQQALSGQFNDWHPITHTLLIAGLIRLWQSPAIVALAQILALAGVLTLGICVLERHTAPKPVLWFIAIAFALCPPIPLLSATLWKDVPYAIAVFALFIILLQIALTQGEWLKGKLAWVWLAASALLAALFRQNGLPVSLVTLAALPFIYKKYRRQTLAALLVCTSLWALVKFPLASALERDKPTETSQLNIVLLPHLAAHIEQGTPLAGDEAAYLSSLLPLKDWDYDCCYIGNISYSKAFDRATYLQNLPVNLRLAINLFLRDPLVDIRHQACAGEIVWRIAGNICSFKSTHGFANNEPFHAVWIEENPFGLEQASIFPSLVEPMMRIYSTAGIFSDQTAPLLRPGFYLLLIIATIATAGARLKNKHLFITLIPVISQAVVMALINFSPGYRYFLSALYIGIFCVGLLFIKPQQ